MTFYQFASESPVLTTILALIAAHTVIAAAKKLSKFRPVTVQKPCDCPADEETEL